MQEIIVGIVVLIAIVYLVFRVRQLMKGDSGCGCSQGAKNKGLCGTNACGCKHETKNDTEK